MAALSFQYPTTAAPLFHRQLDDGGRDVSYLQDVHPDVTDALLGFVYDPLDPAVNAGLDEFLNLPLHHDDDDDQKHRVNKKPRADDGAAWFDFTATDAADGIATGQPWDNAGAQPAPEVLPQFLTEFALPLPPPPPQVYPPAFVRGSDAKRLQANEGRQQQPSTQSAAARERRRRISEKTAELSRLIPGGQKLNTAEMLQEAARHVKLLQAQVGMLALLRTIEVKARHQEHKHRITTNYSLDRLVLSMQPQIRQLILFGFFFQEEKVPAMAQEQMHALLVSGGVQERLAAEGKCLVPRQLVDAVAKDPAVKSNALVNRDLARFMESLPAAEQQ